MFAKNSKAYSVYLLFRFVCSLAVSMSTVLSIVYHLEVVQLDAFQLVLVGTVQETSCFLFEMPTGVVADLYSRRRSVLIGMFLYSGFSVAHRPHGEKRDCQPNQCGHVHQRRVYPVPGSLRGGAELLVHVVGVPAGGAYAHHQGACAGRLDERPSG